MRTFVIGSFLFLSVCAVAVSRASSAEPAPAVVTFDASGERTLLVADPAAAQRKALAIDVASGLKGSHKLKTSAAQLAPGRYRVTLYARLHAGAADNLSRIRFDWSLGGVGPAAVKKSFVWTQFDSTPNRYTPLVLETTILAASSPTLQLDWAQVSTGALDKVQSIRKEELPTSPDAVAIAPKKPKSIAGGDDLLSEIKAESAPLMPLSSLHNPALLLDRVTFEPLTAGSVWIESVRPQFVHVYPNQLNPIDVQIRSLSAGANAEVRLDLLAGLDEVVHSSTQTLKLSGGTTNCRFEWPGGPREFGHEARVTVLSEGKPLDVRSEYFSCSFPIWKTAMQASGFLDFHDRLAQFPDHVAYNRRNYLNVEEAFSWQPSSWTDLTPKNDHWWTGQGDAHNSRAGLEMWMKLSHAEGIKMITYLWPTASGPEGLEWGRETPELVTHDRIGLPNEFFDVEDLRLKPITEADPKLWDLRSGIWNYVGINMGMLRSVDKGISETVASAKQFGWDGARFDNPPGWSAMGATDVHGEFQLLGVEATMKKLVPDFYDKKEGQWSGTEVSLGNVRYARHQLQAHDPHFAMSFNFGIPENINSPEGNKFFDECCLGGGQIMDEQIRQVVRGPWKGYLERIHTEANVVRKRGGHLCCVVASGFSASMRLYAICSLFIGGSHPYGDYGWSAPLPGNYAQFMTRYGEYCWAGDLEPTTAEAEQFSIDDDSQLWWRELPRRRTLPDGRTQWVVHLLSNPPSPEMAPDKPGTMTPWRTKFNVGRKTAKEPTVWALSAEPTTRAEALTAKKVGDRYVVEIPEHRVWTMLVWTEAAR
ncbi:MAG: hypothetical protein K8U03_26315 [Planctomycetia bacterium]|nr:hypothetical protein [Planctomycetia bacterium]